MPYPGPRARYRSAPTLNSRALGLASLCTLALIAALMNLSSNARFSQDIAPALVVVTPVQEWTAENEAADQLAREDSPENASKRAPLARASSREAASFETQATAPIEAPVALAAQAPSPLTLPLRETLETPPIARNFDAPGVSDAAPEVSPRVATASSGQGQGQNGQSADGTGAGGRKLSASWAPSMNFKRLDRYFPDDARGTGVTGKVTLRCMTLRRDRVRNCQVMSEAPRGMGFGKAALRAERTYRLRVFDAAGKRTYDQWVYFEAVFQARD